MIKIAPITLPDSMPVEFRIPLQLKINELVHQINVLTSLSDGSTQT